MSDTKRFTFTVFVVDDSSEIDFDWRLKRVEDEIEHILQNMGVGVQILTRREHDRSADISITFERAVTRDELAAASTAISKILESLGLGSRALSEVGGANPSASADNSAD